MERRRPPRRRAVRFRPLRHPRARRPSIHRPRAAGDPRARRRPSRVTAWPRGQTAVPAAPECRRVPTSFGPNGPWFVLRHRRKVPAGPRRPGAVAEKPSGALASGYGGARSVPGPPGWLPGPVGGPAPAACRGFRRSPSGSPPTSLPIPGLITLVPSSFGCRGSTGTRSSPWERRFETCTRPVRKHRACGGGGQPRSSAWSASMHQTGPSAVTVAVAVLAYTSRLTLGSCHPAGERPVSTVVRRLGPRGEPCSEQLVLCGSPGRQPRLPQARKADIRRLLVLIGRPGACTGSFR